MHKAIVNLEEFHSAFEIPIHRVPHIPPQGRQDLRICLIVEEVVNELLPAMREKNLVKIADGIAYSLYVLIGAALEYGIPLGPVFNEVHRSNMTKVWADGTVKRREDGKILKPPTYSPADIASVLRTFGWTGE